MRNRQLAWPVGAPGEQGVAIATLTWSLFGKLAGLVCLLVKKPRSRSGVLLQAGQVRLQQEGYL